MLYRSLIQARSFLFDISSCLENLREAKYCVLKIKLSGMRIKHQESTMCTWYTAKKELLINSSLNKNVRIWHFFLIGRYYFKFLYWNISPNNNKTPGALWLLSEVITTWIRFSASAESRYMYKNDIQPGQRYCRMSSQQTEHWNWH